MKRTMLFLIGLLLAIAGIVTACGDGHKEREEKRMELEKQQKDAIFNGKVGTASPDNALKGLVFVDRDKTHRKIVFDSTTNSCVISEINDGSVLQAHPAAVYMIKDSKITLDFTKYSMMMSKITDDEVLAQHKKQLYAELKNKGVKETDFDKQWEAYLKEYKEKGHGTVQDMIKAYRETFVKLYTEYLKEKPLEGVLSADKKTITFKKFAIPGYNKIERHENVVFTRVTK